MKVYIKDKETNEILQTCDDVINYDNLSVEYYINGYRCKIYIDTETQYLDDKEF